jgi:hypothetical protein
MLYEIGLEHLSKIVMLVKDPNAPKEEEKEEEENEDE